MALFGFDNVHYEANSQYPFLELNESQFIEGLFQALVEVMLSSFDDFEFYIFSNHEQGAMPISSSITSGRKKVLLYFSDEKGEDPKYLADHYFAIFKSYVPTALLHKNVFPLALGYVKDVPELPAKPIHEREYNVFFRGNLNVSRLPFYKSFSFLKNLLPDKMWGKKFLTNHLVKFKSDYSDYFPQSIIYFNDKFKSGLTPSEYGEILADSKIVLCPKGFSSSECFRHYEAMRAGCIIISEELPHNELYEGSPILQVSSWREGLKLAEELINDPDRMRKLHEAALFWWKTRWSEKATAGYIKSKLLDLIV